MEGPRWVGRGGQVTWIGAREGRTHWGELVGASMCGRVGNIGGGGPCMGSHGSVQVGCIGVA